MKNDTIKLIVTETLLIENKKSTKKDQPTNTKPAPRFPGR